MATYFTQAELENLAKSTGLGTSILRARLRGTYRSFCRRRRVALPSVRRLFGCGRRQHARNPSQRPADEHLAHDAGEGANSHLSNREQERPRAPRRSALVRPSRPGDSAKRRLSRGTASGADIRVSGASASERLRVARTVPTVHPAMCATCESGTDGLRCALGRGPPLDRREPRAPDLAPDAGARARCVCACADALLLLATIGGQAGFASWLPCKPTLYAP
jgi:hypothetical protein